MLASQLTRLLFFMLIFLSQATFANTTVNYVGGGGGGNYSDVDLTSAIISGMAKEPSISNLNVGITTSNRVVSLTGNVSSFSDAANIIAYVASTPGVTNVDTSQLTLTDGKSIPIETVLTAKVKGALVREKVFGNATLQTLPITVTTNNNIVYLKGFVESQSQLIYAVKVAQMVPGVPRVISELQVKFVDVNTN